MVKPQDRLGAHFFWGRVSQCALHTLPHGTKTLPTKMCLARTIGRWGAKTSRNQTSHEGIMLCRGKHFHTPETNSTLFTVVLVEMADLKAGLQKLTPTQ